MQLGVVFAAGVLFLGSFALAPDWTMGKRLHAIAFLPAGLSIVFTLGCFAMGIKLYRVLRDVQQAVAKHDSDSGV